VCRTDEECIRDCLGEHPEAFRLLVSRHQDCALGISSGTAWQRGRSFRSGPGDFRPRVFFPARFKKPGSFPAWLLGIANRVVKETCAPITTSERCLERAMSGRTPAAIRRESRFESGRGGRPIARLESRGRTLALLWRAFLR